MQVIHDEASHAAAGSLPRLSFYLDGAHTAESMASCAQWFSEAAGQAAGVAASGRLITKRVLLFNCMQASRASARDLPVCSRKTAHSTSPPSLSQPQEREPENLLQPLAETLASGGVSIDQALFVPGESAYANLDKTGTPEDLAWQHSLRAVWERNSHACRMGEGRPLPSLTLPTTTAVPGLLVHGGVKGAVLPSLQVWQLLPGRSRMPEGCVPRVLATVIGCCSWQCR